ncbi:aminoacyl-tRNA hydrolase [Methylotenera sp.]|uniref:aminoacyl-tRNA hydrolase n=1 Tax=Methylotenera sp. TaxID=2051956 RepID=UPI0027301C23|nr:aminoacyl-tRNA hydrolase [Methylotenera sp.]MDP2070907.1 aminoacyl-tRNA hydrolase [Methylotenera sp.]MDP3005781.1 aminoacyl-tRNA hydrolase [Methylotenera sp.]
MSGIKLFVGLGNPGDKYAATRHNAGFWWVDQLAVQTNSKLSLDAKFFGIAGKLNVATDTWLLKPTTFMNASGKAVAALANYYKILPAQILVIHDELDLQPSTAKLKKGGGNGGHNGLKDISAALGTQDFWRLRLGIGHPGDRNEVVNFVLKAPTKDEQTAINQCVDESMQILPQLLSGDFENAMLKLHTRK